MHQSQCPQQWMDRKETQGAIHRRGNIGVGAAWNLQTIFGKSCRVFEQNKINLQIRHTLRDFLPFHGCGAVDKFPPRLCERGSCAVLGSKETEMMFHYSLRVTLRSPRTLSLLWLPDFPTALKKCGLVRTKPPAPTGFYKKKIPFSHSAAGAGLGALGWAGCPQNSADDWSWQWIIRFFTKGGIRF